MSSASTVDCTVWHHMNMDIDNVIVEDELDDQLGYLLLAELLKSTAQEEQLVADLVGSSVGRYTAKRRIMLRSMSCLLYTSPSPRDRTRSRMPSSA